MAKYTPSTAKNKIRRSLVAIYDPLPSKKEENTLWQYFESHCAYCNVLIDRNSRTGHLDHLVSSAEWGANNIHNLVLACAKCNGDEKREESWLSFLKRKSESELAHNARRQKIELWRARNSSSKFSIDFYTEAEAIIKEALDNFDFSVQKMRSLYKLSLRKSE